MIEGEKASALLPKSWRKFFNSGIIIPTKMRFCNSCSNKRMCNKCNNLVNENKEVEANLILLRRRAASEVGYTLPYFKG